MACCMEGAFMRSSNSSLSRVPLPSASASLKLLRRNSMKAFCLLSCSRRCSSLRLEVAAIISSEAMPVNTEISVQEAKAMKSTKNTRSQACPTVKGPIKPVQSSRVTTLKRVKIELLTDWNRSSASVLSSMLSCSLLRTMPSTTMKCRDMAEANRNMKRTRNTQTKPPNIETSALRKVVSWGNSLNMRAARSNRKSLTSSIMLLCLPNTGATSQMSMIPKMIKEASRIDHPRSLPVNR
mmetsp:Transcript_104108/g.310914  ORF Transcript_104108/g.310914 Transcript_104108/m.310914 type:complete len:238 (-) Transcript_104108:359-1072(-)